MFGLYHIQQYKNLQVCQENKWTVTAEKTTETNDFEKQKLS